MVEINIFEKMKYKHTTENDNILTIGDKPNRTSK